MDLVVVVVCIEFYGLVVHFGLACHVYVDFDCYLFIRVLIYYYCFVGGNIYFYGSWRGGRWRG